MPRQGRIDYPGALHHVIVRGMERRKLFRNNVDRKAFLERLGKFLEATSNRCCAFALMSNHFHLLTITGQRPLSSLMQSLLTSYAGYYNRRHARTGKLYENRYKSILCEYDQYFLALVRYIHLNPVKAGLVRGMRGLREYKWTGHRALIGKEAVPWLEGKEVLGHFGKRVAELVNENETHFLKRIKPHQAC